MLKKIKILLVLNISYNILIKLIKAEIKPCIIYSDTDFYINILLFFVLQSRSSKSLNNFPDFSAATAITNYKFTQKSIKFVITTSLQSYKVNLTHTHIT